MKKLLIALCALLLAVPGPALAQCDFTAFCGELPVLTLQYDESAFALDTESYLSGSVGGHVWIGMLSNRAVTVEMAADLCPDLPVAFSVQIRGDLRRPFPDLVHEPVPSGDRKLPCTQLIEIYCKLSVH